MSTQGVAAQSLVTFRNSQGTEARGTLLKLTRSAIVFEVYNPYSIVQLSEVLQELTLRRREKIVYRGRAVVSNLVNTGLMLVVSVTLVDSWSDLPEALRNPSALKTEAERFFSEWASSQDITPDYRESVGRLKSFLHEYSGWIGQVENEGDQTCSEVDDELFHNLSVVPNSTMPDLFGQFEEAAKQIPPEDTQKHKRFAQRELHPLIMRSPFVHRAYTKPLGYAGDYEMVNMMLRPQREGPTLFSQVVNSANLKTGPAEAHRNRINILVERLTTESQSAKQEKPVRILDIGCGPAIEVQRFIRENELATSCSFTLLDFSKETLSYTKSKIAEAVRDSGGLPTIEFVEESVHNLLKYSRLGKSPFQDNHFDFVYCAGLFDYLSDKVCSRLITLFHQWTKPGGLTLLTNVHPSNTSLYWMEHVLEWHLIYRDEKGMESIAPNFTDKRVYIDKTGINVFLEIRKTQKKDG